MSAVTGLKFPVSCTAFKLNQDLCNCHIKKGMLLGFSPESGAKAQQHT